MADKRRNRKNCRVFMKVLDQETDRVMGYLVNITAEGVMLTSEAAMEIGINFYLRVLLPEEIKGIKEMVIPSTSRWCEKDEESPGFFNIGFKIVDLPKKETKIIKQLMKKYCF